MCALRSPLDITPPNTIGAPRRSYSCYLEVFEKLTLVRELHSSTAGVAAGGGEAHLFPLRWCSSMLFGVELLLLAGHFVL